MIFENTLNLMEVKFKCLAYGFLILLIIFICDVEGGRILGELFLSHYCKGVHVVLIASYEKGHKEILNIWSYYWYIFVTKHFFCTGFKWL